MTSGNPLRDRGVLVEDESTYAWDELNAEEEDEDAEDVFRKPQKPAFFTRAKVDATEKRPAAVSIMCQFLDKLTAHCKADLVKMGCTRHHVGHGPQDAESIRRLQKLMKESWEKKMLRLKVYQRAFSSLVIHFKAYCPVLFYIKKTYEDMLIYRVNQIKVAHFEKKRLLIQQRQFKAEMQNYRFPEYKQLLKVEKYVAILRQRIGVQEEAIKVITNILDKMEQSLSDHFERHRDLEEQILMIDTEIANRRQKAFSQREKEAKEAKEKAPPAPADNTAAFLGVDDEDIDLEDDPFFNAEDVDEERKMVWIMAFAVAHKDLEDAERKLNLFQTKYQHVIPRHEHENMKRSIKDEIALAKTLADEKSTLEDELVQLKTQEEKFGVDLAEIKVQLVELRTSVTPRPSWENLGEFIPGGVPKWEKMIQGKSTKEVTEKLYSELRGRRGAEKFIQPLGTQHSVLRCLQYGKKVIDRQLHSRDAALLIHDIWEERSKALHDYLTNPPTKEDFDFGKHTEITALKSFPDFVAIYFETNYEDVDLRMEWTYNLVESCKRFSLDYRLTSFLDILQGRLDENAYFITRNELLRVRNFLLHKSVEEDMTGGMLSSNQYVEAIEEMFPSKLETDFQSLVRVTNKVNAELNSGEGADLSMYHITQLIDLRDDGFRGALVSEIVKQFEEGRQAFLDKILENLANILEVSPQVVQKENDPAADKDVSVMNVFAAIRATDIEIKDVESGAALAWIFTGTSVVPGGGISTSRLVNYCKLHGDPSPSEMDVATAGKADEENFERAIKDILRENEDPDKEEEKVSEAQKKALYKALKYAKLRTVVKRLKSTALLPSWQHYDPTTSGLPNTAVDVNVHIDGPEGLRAKLKHVLAPIDIVPIGVSDEEANDMEEEM